MTLLSVTLSDMTQSKMTAVSKVVTMLLVLSTVWTTVQPQQECETNQGALPFYDPCYQCPYKCLGRLTVSDPEDCTGYYLCLNNTLYHNTCPSGQYFDYISHACSVKAFRRCQPQCPAGSNYYKQYVANTTTGTVSATTIMTTTKPTTTTTKPTTTTSGFQTTSAPSSSVMTLQNLLTTGYPASLRTTVDERRQPDTTTGVMTTLAGVMTTLAGVKTTADSTTSRLGAATGVSLTDAVVLTDRSTDAATTVGSSTSLFHSTSNQLNSVPSSSSWQNNDSGSTPQSRNSPALGQSSSTPRYPDQSGQPTLTPRYPDQSGQHTPTPRYPDQSVEHGFQNSTTSTAPSTTTTPRHAHDDVTTIAPGGNSQVPDIPSTDGQTHSIFSSALLTKGTDSSSRIPTSSYSTSTLPPYSGGSEPLITSGPSPAAIVSNPVPVTQMPDPVSTMSIFSIYNESTVPTTSNGLSNTTATVNENITNAPAYPELKLSLTPDPERIFEGTTVQFLCSFRYYNSLESVRVQDFYWSLGGEAIVSGEGAEIKNNLTMDPFGYFTSVLTIGSIKPVNSGNVSCMASYNGLYSMWSDGIHLVVHPLPTLSIYPLELTVLSMQRFLINCSLELNSSHILYDDMNFVWFKNSNMLYPNGTDTISNSSSFGWSTLDVMSDDVETEDNYTCQVQFNAIGVQINQSCSVTTVLNTDRTCPDSIDAAGISWPLTKVGTSAKQQCPRNMRGMVTRDCVISGNGSAGWLPSNFINCTSWNFPQLNDKITMLENGMHSKNGSIGADIASSLAAFTSPPGDNSSLSPGDMNAALDVLNRISRIRNGNSDLPVNRQEIQSIVHTISNVLNPINKGAWATLQTENSTISSVLMSTGDIYGNILSKSLDPGATGTISMDYMVLQANQIETNQIQSNYIQFPVNMSTSGNNWFMSSNDSISISKQSLDKLKTTSGTTAVWSNYYRNLNDYLPQGSGMDGMIGTRVLSLSIDGLQTGEKLADKVTISLQHTKRNFEKNYTRSCVFWKFDPSKGGNWSSDGCQVVSTNETHTVCQCDHLTNFAILMSVTPETLQENMILSIISLTGCAISIVALVLTIIVLAVTWKQMKTRHHMAVLINLCVALIVANALFIGGIDKTSQEGLCTAVAALLHYFYLAAFFMMLAEGFQMLFYIVFVFHVRKVTETAMLIIAGWVLPLVIVAVSLGVTRTEGYGSDKACWLSVSSGLIWAFVGPVLAIILINFIILIVVLRRISQAKFGTDHSEKKSRIRATLWNILVISPILGITWVFGVLSVNHDLIAFQYIFAIANTLQGVFIFIFHALCTNRSIRYSLSQQSCFDRRQSKPSLPDQRRSVDMIIPKMTPESESVSADQTAVNFIVPTLVNYYQELGEKGNSSNTQRKNFENFSEWSNSNSAGFGTNSTGSTDVTSIAIPGEIGFSNPDECSSL